MRLILARQAIYDASTLKEIGSEILSRWITNTNKVFCPSDINPDWALVDVEVISQLSSNTNNLCTNSDALFKC